MKNNESTTMDIRNAGLSADRNVITLIKLIA